MMFRHRVCAYVQYRQMLSICIDTAYADARHIDMFSLYMFLSFSAGIRKKAVPDQYEIIKNMTETHKPISPTCYL